MESIQVPLARSFSTYSTMFKTLSRRVPRAPMSHITDSVFYAVDSWVNVRHALDWWMFLSTTQSTTTTWEGCHGFSQEVG